MFFSAIVTKRTGETLTEYLTPRLFDPLGITKYYWETCPKGLQKAAGDCFSVQKTWQNSASCIFRGENGMVSSWCLNIG